MQFNATALILPFLVMFRFGPEFFSVGLELFGDGFVPANQTQTIYKYITLAFDVGIIWSESGRAKPTHIPKSIVWTN
jgi:hypothetical protein